MSKLPPAYHHLTKHKLMPEISHDDTSRFNFLISLNKHLSELSKGNKTVYEKNVSSKIWRRIKKLFDAEQKMTAHQKLFSSKKNFIKISNPNNLEKVTRIFFNQRRKKIKTPFNILFKGNYNVKAWCLCIWR